MIGNSGRPSYNGERKYTTEKKMTNSQKNIDNIQQNNFDITDIEPVIIFIPDVFITDCVVIDDIFEQSLLSDANDDKKNNPDLTSVERDVICRYDKIPSTFYSTKQWPASTNLLCWRCHMPFDGKPLFLPTSIEDAMSSNTNHVVMSIEGCFCSYTHILEYIVDNYPEHEHASKVRMVEYEYAVFEGKRLGRIQNSVSIYEMEQYGGTLTKEQYRSMILV